MLFNRHDQFVGASLRKYGEFSPGETALFRQIVPPGGTVLEIGANIGAHTVALSRMAGPSGVVVAFEPQRIAFQTLCANLALNGCANVLAFQEAVGAEPGQILVPFLPPDRPSNFGGLSLIGAAQGERVALRRIDDLGLSACHVMKLDCEGMETEALRGAEETISRFQPHLYVENDRRERSEELIGLLRSWNYDLYWHLPPLFEPSNFAGDDENIFAGLISINMFCVALERQITVQGLERVAGPAP